MSRLAGLIGLIVLGAMLQNAGLVWDASILSTYELMFACLGVGTIVFMVAVVSAGDSGPPALPPSFQRATLTGSTRCLVCNGPSGAGWVTCTRCDTPHHADCARYLAHCAVFGCDKSVPLLPVKPAAAPTRTAEPR